MDIKVNLDNSIAADKENKTLNKPFRTPKGPKKFGVYVKNEKGNVVIVRFGDPNMEIKRDDPNRRKNFRARHQCDSNPGPKWKARYWSCKMWEKGKSVTDYTKGSVDSWDGKELWDQDELLRINPALATADEEGCGCGNGCGCDESEAGLWENIRKKRQRIKDGSGEKMRKKGDKGAPTPDQIKKAQGSHEGNVEMAKSQLKKANEQLLELIDIMASQKEVEGWVLSKVTKIEDYIDAIYGYLKYNKEAEKEVGVIESSDKNKE